MHMKQDQALPNWLYLWLPVAMLLAPYVLNAGFPAAADVYFAKESGLAENLTALFLIVALYYSIKCLSLYRHSELDRGGLRLLRIWLIICLLGVVYYLGEEISWGQHLFKWATPDSWTQINYQQETNLHNTFGIFDQVPRTLITLGIIVGGLFVPAFMRVRRISFDRRSMSYWILPNYSLIPVSLTVLIISVHDKVFQPFGLEVPAALEFKDGEVKELLIALAIMIYIIAVYRRLDH